MDMEELVERAQSGDTDAFVELMESQMTNLYKAARAMLSSEDDAADAISDTILTCWEKLGQLREKRFFRTCPSSSPGRRTFSPRRAGRASGASR